MPLPTHDIPKSLSLILVTVKWRLWRFTRHRKTEAASPATSSGPYKEGGDAPAAQLHSLPPLWSSLEGRGIIPPLSAGVGGELRYRRTAYLSGVRTGSWWKCSSLGPVQSWRSAQTTAGCSGTLEAPEGCYQQQVLMGSGVARMLRARGAQTCSVIEQEGAAAAVSQGLSSPRWVLVMAITSKGPA